MQKRNMNVLLIGKENNKMPEVVLVFYIKRNRMRGKVLVLSYTFRESKVIKRHTQITYKNCMISITGK